MPTTLLSLKAIHTKERNRKSVGDPEMHFVLQLMKGWSAYEVNRTFSFPYSLLSAMFPQACSSSTPSEHHCHYTSFLRCELIIH